MRLLCTVGLAEKALNYPDELSGGQKQRIAIARTLAMDPEIILLDEPTSALDPTMVGEVKAVIRDLSKTGKTMMIVTHEMAFARAICNRVFYMDEGGIYEEGTPEEIFEHPRRENTRRFVRRLKVLELNITNKNYDFLGMATQISEYCRKNQIAPKLENRTQLAFEELVEQLLRNTMGHGHIQAVLEYSEIHEQMTMIVRSDGPKLKTAPDSVELSVKLIRSAITTVEYSWEEDSDLPNRLVLHIKSEG
jgi:polar amino acid transport system ATP-binding protein